jgi:hypothetical protein
VQFLGKGLITGDFPRPLPGPGWHIAVSSVEGVMDDDLPPGEELDVGTTDAKVGDLFMFEPIIGRYYVEGFTHRSPIGRLGRQLKLFTHSRHEGTVSLLASREFERRKVRWGCAKLPKPGDSVAQPPVVSEARLLAVPMRPAMLEDD